MELIPSSEKMQEKEHPNETDAVKYCQNEILRRILNLLYAQFYEKLCSRGIVSGMKSQSALTRHPLMSNAAMHHILTEEFGVEIIHFPLKGNCRVVSETLRSWNVDKLEQWPVIYSINYGL
jgi:hypothetical protein